MFKQRNLVTVDVDYLENVVFTEQAEIYSLIGNNNIEPTVNDIYLAPAGFFVVQNNNISVTVNIPQLELNTIEVSNNTIPITINVPQVLLGTYEIPNNTISLTVNPPSIVLDSFEVTNTVISVTVNAPVLSLSSFPVSNNVISVTVNPVVIETPSINIPNTVITTTVNRPFHEHVRHIAAIGQSQLGGVGGVAQSALTTVGVTNVITVEGGPTDGDFVTGNFETLVEETRETMATSMGQQWYSMISDPGKFICLTFHHRGSTTIQDLGPGGLYASLGYDDAVNAMARVSALCASNNRSYNRDFILHHGGTGENLVDQTYAEAVEFLFQSLITNSPAGSSPTPFIWAEQMRVAGGANDYGDQLFTLQSTFTNFKVTGPRQDHIDAGELQGDGVHPTNWGQIHSAMYYALAMYDDLEGSGHQALQIDYDNVTFDADNDRLVFPVLGAALPIVGTGNYNLVVQDETNGTTFTGSWSVSGSDLHFDISSSIPVGQTITLVVEAGYDSSLGTLVDSRGNSNIIFNNEATATFAVEKNIARNTYSRSMLFPNTATTNTVLINNNNSSGSDVSSTDDQDTPQRHWNNFDYGLGSLSSLINTLGNTVSGLQIAVAGGNSGNDAHGLEYDDGVRPLDVYDSTHWTQNQTMTYTISGLTEGDSVVLTATSCRDTAATNRVGLITPTGETGLTIDAAANPPGSITFPAITIGATGELVFVVEPDPVSSSAYAYVNTIEITIN